LPLPGRIRVPVGEVNVRMDAPGFKVNRQDVEVAADQVKRVNIDLVPVNGASPAPRLVQAQAVRTMGAPGSRRRGAAPGNDDASGDVSADSFDGGSTARPTSPYRTAGWITAGAGVVLLGAGVAALVVKESSTQDFNDYMKDVPSKRCNEAVKGNGGATCTTYLDRSRTAKIIGYSALAGAALAGVVSVILLSANPVDQAVAQLSPAVAARRSGTLARGSSQSLRCAPSLLQLGGACALTF
jgi:hypothetical protein